MPKPRVLQKYEVDESRCILCGICVDACPYDALRDGGEFELAHSSRAEPMIDLMAMAQVDRETEVTYIRKERDWLQRAVDAGRFIDSDRLLTVLPATLSRTGDSGNGAHGGNGGNGSHGDHADHGDHAGHGGSHAHLK